MMFIRNRVNTRSQLKQVVLVVFATMTYMNGNVGTSLAQEHEVIEGGRYLYQKYCVSCHGTRAVGDGPMAPSLEVRPANLTLLSKNNGGRFPFWETYQVIDGRQQVLNHGPREMPVWGIWFRIPDDVVSTETEWADQVRGRLWQLLAYLQSVQEP